MKIVIDSYIKCNINDIENVNLVITNKHNQVSKLHISEDHIKKLNFIELHDNIFKQCKKLFYKIEKKSGQISTISYSSKYKAVLRQKPPEPSGIRKNINEEYKNKNKFFGKINSLIKQTEKICITDHRGTKNLIYFSVYFNGPYLDLLNLSINSLLKHNKQNFDILVITDNCTKNLIKNLSFTKKIKPRFHITETPIDGVAASINKLNVFDYKFINLYKNILYLDCDIICYSNIDNLFSNINEPNKLYTASNKELTPLQFKTIQHGFPCLTQRFVKEMSDKQQIPFNAGQFAFQNTVKMESHFNNVRWMIKNWNGEYFFEQCFMNYYFCKAGIANNNLLNDYTEFVLTTSDYQNKTNKPLVHYIAPALNGDIKLNFITNHLAFKEQTKYTNFTINIKDYYISQIPNLTVDIILVNHNSTINGATLSLYGLYKFLIEKGKKVLILEPSSNKTLLANNSINETDVLCYRGDKTLLYWMCNKIQANKIIFNSINPCMAETMQWIDNSKLILFSREVKQHYMYRSVFEPHFVLTNKIAKTYKQKPKVQTPILLAKELKKIEQDSKQKVSLFLDNKITIGMCGDTNERKNFSLFLEVAQSLPQYNFLWIGGILNKPLPSNVFHVEETNAPAAYYKFIDYFALFSEIEPFGRVVLENLYLGNKVLAFEDNIFYDHKQKNLENIYFEYKGSINFNSAIEHIENICKTKYNKSHIRAKGKKYVLENFTKYSSDFLNCLEVWET